MVRVQPHTEASTQLAMIGLYAVPLFHSQNWNRSLGGLPVTRQRPSCLNWRKLAITLEQPTRLSIWRGVRPPTHQLQAEATKHVQLGRPNLSCISISRRSSRR